ncbi:hypothetical protein [Streptomyces litchfieldiae]|uniref:Uncharacterized protein n=1 Tax=Streptomyces litchfieldiae TaxID=3075543 RepID=A0ABU2MPX2_9ACTN|nr:hypothetical protein [Streptomyces sp. DSM 44938]MDT0343654.1 hypothetical protein [Streptomyces sp. DSM 44938]
MSRSYRAIFLAGPTSALLPDDATDLHVRLQAATRPAVRTPRRSPGEM